MLSKNFSREEFACSDGCGFDVVDKELLDIVQDVRDHFDRPVSISGGNRCWDNHVRIYKELGLGTPPKKSGHLLGLAADIKVKGVSPTMVKAYVDRKYGEKVNIGLYNTFVHIGIDEPRGRRWNG